MNSKHYCDYITVDEEYRPVMDKATINKKVDTWLSFFPHEKYLKFLQKLQAQLNEGSKSVWLYGNYGTGKSHAALVTQKLFMDDQSRVEQWFKNNHQMFPKNDIFNDLIKLRNQGTFVVYDYNASGLEADKEFLVRLEKTIRNALTECNMVCPASGALENAIARIEREGENFFKARDKIQSQLVHLKPEIKTVKELVARLRTDPHHQDAKASLFSDVITVLCSDNIYLDVDVKTFHAWISSILNANKLKRIVYIFDEFSEFINNNQGNLKTFEEVTENPANCNFYFVPVTHLRMEAFLGVNTPGANRAKTRFDFCELQMPNDTALQLAGKAIKVKEGMDKDWDTARKFLFESIKDLTEKFNDSHTSIKEESFRDLLPVHPMAAFLLKFLSESFQSNQRSIFEYLKGGANGHEFQDFLRDGGPNDINRQLLTVDYLWKYFIERDDLKISSNQDIEKVRMQYQTICDREFKNSTDDDPMLRVLRTVMLLWLIEHKVKDGHERLKATEDNVKLAFSGTAINGVKSYLQSLELKHCFSVSKGHIELFGMSDTNTQELDEEVQKLDNQFHEFLSPSVEAGIKNTSFGQSINRRYSDKRFEIRVSDLSHTTLTNITSATRDRFSSNINKDDGSVCLWFVISKTHEDELNIESRAKDLLYQLRDHRILLFSFNNQSFCESDLNAWKEYIKLRARYNKESNKSSKDSLQRQFTLFETEWVNKIKQPSQTLKKYEWKSDALEITSMSWGELQDYLPQYLLRTVPYCIDALTEWQITAFGKSGLDAAAQAGMEFENIDGNSPKAVLFKRFRSLGVEKDSQWYSQHPDHPLTKIHELLMNKISNTVGKGTEFSLRKAYLELKRAPYGMRWNALHAFVLGFALKEVLTKNYQWTDGIKTESLDVPTLCEIIESVVKDDGNGNILKEKRICRMSKEEKEFLKATPKLFGFPVNKDSSIQTALLSVQNRVKEISQNVPLWALEEYIKTQNFAHAESMIDILNKLCVAGQTSAKGKTDAQTEAIKSIGKYFEDTPELIDELSPCLKPDCFIQAFDILVDKQCPEFAPLAQSVHDNSHQYCREILNKTAADSGFLWNRRDISDIIDQTFNEYKVIQLVQKLIRQDNYISYKSAISVLTEAVNKKNRLPLSWITTQYPALTNFVSYINKAGESASNVKNELEQNLKLIQEVFFDILQNAQIKILRRLFPDNPLDDSQLRQELINMPDGLTEYDFTTQFQTRLEELAKDSAIMNLRQRWNEFSGCVTPDGWAQENSLPVRYLLGNCSDANDLVKALNEPSSFSSDRIQELLDVLNALQPISIEKCQKAFLKDMIPAQYAPFNIDFGALASYLKSQKSNPNEWSEHPQLDDFIKERYKSTFAPKIIEKIRAMSADELKEIVIDLARNSQDMGILFMK